MNCGTIATVGGIRIVATSTPNRSRAPRAGSVANANPTTDEVATVATTDSTAISVVLATSRGTSRRLRTPARLSRLGGFGRRVGGDA